MKSTETHQLLEESRTLCMLDTGFGFSAASFGLWRKPFMPGGQFIGTIEKKQHRLNCVAIKVRPKRSGWERVGYDGFLALIIMIPTISKKIIEYNKILCEKFRLYRAIYSIDKEGDDVINCKKQLKRSKESRAKAPGNWRCNLTIYANFCCVRQLPEEGNNEEMQW